MEKMLNNFKERERPKKPHESLGDMIKSVSDEINQEAKIRFGAADLLKADGSIRMENFAKKRGGIYESEKIAGHIRKTFEIEFGFTGAEEKSVADFYREERKCETREDIVAFWKKEKEKSKSVMFEKAIQILLHKFFKDDFLVVRTAPIDDYQAGVDNLLVNKTTGDVICAFDEVHDSKGGEYTAKKIEKVRRIAEKGGANIRYGLTVENGRIKQIEINNVPVFAISLLQAEFEKLLPIMLENGLDRKTEIEKTTIKKLIASLEDQARMIRSAHIKDGVRGNLSKFDRSLEKMAGMTG
jgi:hypothetical protein